MWIYSQQKMVTAFDMISYNIAQRVVKNKTVEDTTTINLYWLDVRNSPNILLHPVCIALIGDL